MRGYSVINVYGVEGRRKKEAVDTTSSDRWAMEQYHKLCKEGYNPRLTRKGRSQALCVIYNLNDVEGAAMA